VANCGSSFTHQKVHVRHGGARRGTDLVKALALGARAVLVGRPIFHGLAAGGAEGVARMLTILRTDGPGPVRARAHRGAGAIRFVALS